MAENYARMISADSHIFEDPYLWENTLGDKYGDEIPHHVPEFNGKKGNYLYTGRDYVRLGDVDKEYRGKDMLTRAGYEPEPRVEFQKEAHVDAEVLYPTLALVLMQSRHFKALTAVAEVYNDWLHEYCSHDPKRLLALGLIPIVDVDWAIGELERCLKRGFRGVIINARASIGTPAYHDPVYDPFWARISESDITLTLHPLNGWVPDAFHPQKPEDEREGPRLLIETFNEIHPAFPGQARSATISSSAECSTGTPICGWCAASSSCRGSSISCGASTACRRSMGRAWRWTSWRCAPAIMYAPAPCMAGSTTGSAPRWSRTLAPTW